jgi:hypothetical protein
MIPVGSGQSGRGAAKTRTVSGPLVPSKRDEVWPRDHMGENKVGNPFTNLDLIQSPIENNVG